MTATDTLSRPMAHPGRLRMVSHLRRLAAAGLVEPPCGARTPQYPEDEDAEVWDDFRHRLAALLVGLHEEAKAPRPAHRAVHVGATVMAFPLHRRFR
ncbi:hypothetical protein [Actinacidiphila glaucinigra]|uniref:hypothetical protein n=1 Tax=Actinacidiphila glaucinigra TaxID=235986 RepID=UPI0029A1C177|nr:hypothetical protein [Streptomyces sp. PA03-3a]